MVPLFITIPIVASLACPTYQQGVARLNDRDLQEQLVKTASSFSAKVMGSKSYIFMIHQFLGTGKPGEIIIDMSTLEIVGAEQQEERHFLLLTVDGNLMGSHEVPVGPTGTCTEEKPKDKAI